MKKVLRVICNIFLLLSAIVTAVVIFLYAFYSITENKQAKQNLQLEKNNQIRVIQADTILTGTAEKTLLLLPLPQKYRFSDGSFTMPQHILFIADTLQDTIRYYLGKTAGFSSEYAEKKPHIIFTLSDSIPEQGYDMDIQEDYIAIVFSSIKGLHYALVSLKVLNRNYNGKLPCVSVKDYPDLAVRGMLLDISRDKVPKLNTLLDLVQKLSDLKYNHFELYIEGYSFAYPSFRHLWEGKETPLEGNEISILDTFCKARFIDLVPCQNSPGQMPLWLAKDSIDRIRRMTEDIMPYFSSAMFNVNLAEPFEPGREYGNKQLDKVGEGEVYLDFTSKIHDLVSAQNKRMLLWADIVLRHPEIIDHLPQDITLLDRGYESEYPFEKNCRFLRSSDRRFMLCPGTSSWTTITGKTTNMLRNIASAAINAVKYEADGLLLTDWGDMGHWQYLPVSYAGYAAAAALSWNSESMGAFPLADFLNNYIFRDSRSIMGDLVLDMGRYRQFEEIEVPNMTTTMLAFKVGLEDKLMVNAILDEMISGMPDETRHPFDYSGLMTFLDEKEALLNNTDLMTEDGRLIKDEYMNAIRLIRTGTQLQFFIQTRNALSPEEEILRLNELKSSILAYLDENKRLWTERNKSGGYERSVTTLKNLILQIDQNIALAEKPFLSRQFRRFKEKITTSADILNLRYF